MDVVTEYLKLGLRFDRVVSGFVDAYIGDPALRQQVADGPNPIRRNCPPAQSSCPLGSQTPACPPPVPTS